MDPLKQRNAKRRLTAFSPPLFPLRAEFGAGSNFDLEPGLRREELFGNFIVSRAELFIRPLKIQADND